MITVDLAALFERVNPFCRRAVEEAGSLCIEQRAAEVTEERGHTFFSILQGRSK
ncbi:hypothetical protein D3C72_2371640 [compost metagenome]